jgi:hypothetical protein
MNTESNHDARRENHRAGSLPEAIGMFQQASPDTACIVATGDLWQMVGLPAIRDHAATTGQATTACYAIRS